MNIRHLSIVENGIRLNLLKGRLVVSNEDTTLAQYPLSRLQTVSIARRGVSLSTNLISECALRGIRIFIMGFQPQATACISGAHQHAVVQVRRSQFKYLDSSDASVMAKSVIYGKIRNQRSVLLYFTKYMQKTGSKAQNIMQETAESLSGLSKAVLQIKAGDTDLWRSQILGYEGKAAALYWQCLRHSSLLPEYFSGRKGRGAEDACNQALNLGYSILSTYVWNALVNAGLEVYSGALHTNRPGKPSLVLDLMEEYRPWVVDRMIVRMRFSFPKESAFPSALKAMIIKEVHRVFGRSYPYKGKKIRLENILQRQIYRLAGSFFHSKQYKPYIFSW